MGIVAKQSVSNTIYTYVGFLFGAINTLFLFTAILNKTDYGLITYLMTAANLLWPFLGLGMHNTVIKFYNKYESQAQKNRFFSWTLIIPIGTSIVTYLLFYIFQKQIAAYFGTQNSIIYSFLWAICVLAFTSVYFELFYAWTKVHLKSVAGNFLKSIFIRVCISILLLLVYFKSITTLQFIYLLSFAYFLRTLIMVKIAYQTHPFNFTLKSITNTKAVVTYSSLILIASIVASYLLDLDKIMIEHFRPIEELPAYSIAIYIASVIAVPARALAQITAPLTANFLAKKDFSALSKLNQQSSLNGLLISGAIAVLILTNTHSIFALVPKNYSLYIEIVFCIALIRIFDASLGVTNSILVNSDNYKWVLILGVITLVIAFCLNAIFIPKYGIIGAALATFLSYVFFNIVKLYFVKFFLGIQPYQKKTISAALALFIIGAGFYFIQFNNLPPIGSILIKGTTCSIILIAFIYFSKLSLELTSMINTFFKIKP